ncbi:tetratricopeptide repeat protein [Paucibacter sp. DJ2R-2]|uniref:O-linked N-acetylglucosamine transferase family protein n=1 Tax=Paucibacter sp. DJ2R-2 TaxID=2893558 RepID=UPI0021E39E07|nr:tetratricopeptide repeat protein [Paucibacter sp. DJ2R-2]MCV2419086.1 SEC-C domain-containing protein [Paucibacter sp. DJ4R-1]MCV2437959.1 SEC-C domain-containing protein [Paucibacter sp. DJ2R-2]
MKTDRNAPCPCGSGLKYKKCHGNPLTPAPAPITRATISTAVLAPERVFAQALDHHIGGELDAAAGLYRELLAAHPGHADVLHNLSLVLFQQGESEAALRLIQQAIEAAPARPEFIASRAAMLVSRGQHLAAVTDYARLGTALDGDAIHNYSVALGRLGRTREALTVCRRRIQQAPADARAHGQLGNLLTDCGEFGAAELAYREALRLRADDSATHSNMLLMLNYSEHLDAAELLQQHRAYGAQHGGVWNQLPPLFANERNLGRRLRVGFLSPDFGEHTVGYLFEPLLSSLDQDRFEPVLFATRQRDDALSRRLRATGAVWRECHAASDAELIGILRRDRIDVLIDLAGHTAGNRLAALARGAAPVQITYLGYPTTTGLDAIGHRFTDTWIDPPGGDAGVEQPLHLACGMFRYAPPPDAPEVREPPMLTLGHASFGCYCNLSKVTPSTLTLWAQVLKAVPDSRLLIKAAALADADSAAGLLDRLSALGVASERVTLLRWTDYAEHLADFSRIDVMLDTIPFNLAGNTCEALWMGVPVVSLRGERPATRMGASLLVAAGRPEWIAEDASHFVRIACELISNPDGLASLRTSQRHALQASALLDGASLAREIEAHCQRLFAAWAKTARPLPAQPLKVLHVGCGSPEAGKLPVYFDPSIWREVRLDIDKQVEPDFVASTTDMKVVPSDSMQALYSSHNVEHLYVSEVPKALSEFLRVLEPGGFALITVPDLRAAAERILRDEQELPMYQSPAGPINALDMVYGYAPFVEGGNAFMIHKTGFTCRSLEQVLTRVGFERVVVRSHGFALWAVAFKPGSNSTGTERGQS